MPIHRSSCILTILIGIHWECWVESFIFNLLSLSQYEKVKAAALEFEKEEETHKDTEDKVRQQVKEAYLRYRKHLSRLKLRKPM
jgi:hypothetical protein